MTINLNGFPYWDDFNEKKGFHQILYKPGFGVQTRELNQMQSILQKQIDRFGKHVFLDGSIVLGGLFAPDVNFDWVDVVEFNSPAEGDHIEDLEHQTIQDGDGIEAYVVKVEATSPTAATLFIRYTGSSSIDNSQTFSVNDSLTVKGGLMTLAVAPADATGKGSLFTIEEGVLFSGGYFVYFEKQSISLGKTTTPSYVVGFNIKSEIKTTNQDISLLDNAQGSYNFLAPGADRLHISAELTKQPLPESDAPEISSSEDFALLYIMKHGELLQTKQKPQYAEIYKELAERTFEESGDYVVWGFGTVVREHLNTGANEGLLPAPDGDETLLAVGVDEGVAYVKGHRVDNHQTHYINVPKSTTVAFVNNEISSAGTGNYIVVSDVLGMPALDSGTVVTLYNAEQNGVSGDKILTAGAVGSPIGTAKVKEFQYNTGTPGAAAATYRLYLYDIIMDSGSGFNNVNGVKIANKFMADVAFPPAKLQEADQESMIFPVGASAVKTIRSEGGSVDTIFTFRRTSEVTIPTNGIFTVSVGTSNETHGYGVSGTLSSTVKRSILIALETGVIRNLDGATVTVDSATQLTVNLGDSFGAQQTGTVTYNVTRNVGREASKTLNSNRFVKISGPTTGPVNLGLSDVTKVHLVRRDNSPITLDDQGDNITSQCRLDNGQRDSFYDHARLILPANLASGEYLLVKLDYFEPDFTNGVGYFSVDSYPVDDTQDSPTTIFTHEIPLYKSPTNGKVYDLRDHYDFRPVKANTAVSATIIADATVNPAANNNDFVQGSGGLRSPASGSQIIADYSYYLSRRDVITVDSEGNFEAIQGVPAVSPASPDVPDSVMGIARIFIPPYPSLATSYANLINKANIGVETENITHKRHTMREIGVLQERIETLEYYNALSLLEKSAVDMLVLDQNGLDRFKNGFFVDGFMDHSLGASERPDYNISIDREEQVLRPYFDMNSFKYIPTTQTNVTTTNGLITTLPFTHAVLLEQMNATTTRNIEQSVFRFVGNIYMTPDSDVWVDTKRVDSNRSSFGGNPRKTMFTQWNSWADHVVGYTRFSKRTVRPSSGGRLSRLLGTMRNVSDAIQRGSPNRQRTIIGELTQQSRTGIKTNVNYQQNTQSLGERVVDVSVQPYIRPQHILMQVRGVKARTRYHIFFDGENMNQYLRPSSVVNGAVSQQIIGAPGDTWISDDYGELFGILILPASGKRFRIGQREVKVTDSMTNSADASSYAVGHFFAHGMTQTKQNTILSTKTPVITQTPLVWRKLVRQRFRVLGPSCMAYSFKPEVPEGEIGCFLTKADVWVESKHDTLGVWFEIREMDNAGNITRNQVPYSEVWYTAGQVNTTGVNRPSEANKFTVEFPAPIFLYNDTEYAFVIHTEGLNPDYYFWISRLGETNRITGRQVNARQLTGNVYTTNNNMNWDMVPDIDLMVRFYRAEFDPAVSGTIELANAPYEFMTVSVDTVNFFDNFGETINSSQILTLGTIVDGPILVGDTILQGGNSGAVVRVSGNKYYTTGLNFANGAITVDGKATTATINLIERGTATLYRADEVDKTLELDGSNGLFFPGQTIVGAESDMTGTIVSLDDWKYSTTQIKPNHLVLHNSTVNFAHRSRQSANTDMTAWEDVDVDTNIGFETERRLVSRSNEIIMGLTPQRSSYVKATLATSSHYVSPVIDMTRINGVYVHNLINNDATGEDNSESGNLINRYISKIVTLADGQDAEDLLVTLSAYRPPNSDVKVWAKIKHSEDSELIDDKEWIELEPQNAQFSSLVNKDDFKEIEFKFPEAMMIGTNDSVRYTANANHFSGFKQFTIKIGLMGTNSAIPPRVGDLRAIALQR